MLCLIRQLSKDDIAIIIVTKMVIVPHLQDSFNISDEIDGSAQSYTITYTDSMTSTVYSSVGIQASSCDGQMCGHQFEVSSSSCVPSADVTITMFATNILGRGQTSNPITIGIVIYYNAWFDYTLICCENQNQRTTT